VKGSEAVAREAEETAPPAARASGDDEASLWERWSQNADAEARVQLVERYVPFARALAARFYGRRHSDEIEFDDYQQLAMVGLMESIDRYQPDRGAKFTTYATARIQGSILNGLERLTERQQQLAFRRRVAAERTASLMPDALSADSSQQLFTQLEEIGVGIALGFLLEGTGMVRDREDALPASAYEHLELRQVREQLWDLAQQLTEREREVFDLHYKQSQAFDDVAQSLGLTKGRVSQLHRQGILRLRALFTKSGSCDVSF
jgi:RNA polymerase sigma factor for flagellar operon FliA